MQFRHRAAGRRAVRALFVAGVGVSFMALGFAADPTAPTKPVPKPEPVPNGPPAIIRGQVTNESDEPLADVRVRVAIPASDMRFVDPTTPHKLFEAKSDAKGNYTVEIPGITKPTKVSVDAMKRGYRRLSGTLMRGGNALVLDLAPGKAVEAPLALEPALYFAGTVVDEQGKPIPAVSISANAETPNSSGGVERTASDSKGVFELFNYSPEPFILRDDTTKGHLYVFHPDYIDVELDDVYALPNKERDALKVVLPTGHRITGTVLDVAGKPVPDALIIATRNDGTHRKGTISDANGRFALRGLAKGVTRLKVRAFGINQKRLLPVGLNSDKDNLEVRLEAIDIPRDLKKYEVLGMQLADVTPELKNAYDLFHEQGAVILDTGHDTDRLKIGQLAEGYCFWIVGEKRIGSVREFVERIVAETADIKADVYSVRIVYSFSTVEFDGNNTQYLKLTPDDVRRLRAVLEKFPREPQ